MLILQLDKRADKFSNRLPPKQEGQIGRKLAELLVAPFPHDSKKLRNSGWYRVDVGEYRIIYRVEESLLKIYVIGKRNDDDVYKKLERLGG